MIAYASLPAAIPEGRSVLYLPKSSTSEGWQESFTISGKETTVMREPTLHKFDYNVLVINTVNPNILTRIDRPDSIGKMIPVMHYLLFISCTARCFYLTAQLWFISNSRDFKQWVA